MLALEQSGVYLPQTIVVSSHYIVTKMIKLHEYSFYHTQFSYNVKLVKPGIFCHLTLMQYIFML